MDSQPLSYGLLYTVISYARLGTFITEMGEISIVLEQISFKKVPKEQYQAREREGKREKEKKILPAAYEC